MIKKTSFFLVMNNGDVLVIDTGTRFDGYFSDFDRNYAFGAAG